MLQIQLFGDPHVLWNNAPLTFNLPDARALLFYLSAQGQPVERSTLAALLWPQNAQQARRLLRKALTHLRADLPNETLILTDRQSISLDFTQISVDYLDFLNLVKTISHTPWRIPPEMPLPASLYNLMNRLTAHYRLPGFLALQENSFSPALTAWRDEIDKYCREITLRCLDRLAEHAHAIGNLTEASTHRRIAAALEPFNAMRQVQMLTSLLESGQKQAALQHYQMLEAAYQSPPQIAALRPQLFSRTQPMRQSKFTWPLRPTIATPFVGREANLKDLRRHFISGGGVAILGESGAGKTRLVQEFYNRLNPSPRLLMGVCRPMAASLPFQVWVNLLRRSIQPTEWESLPLVWMQPLARLMPELHTLRPDLLQPYANMEQPKSVFFEAVRQVLLAISGHDPLIVFLDDIHWADDASLGLITYLLEKGFFTGRHGFLILTARPEEYNTLINRLVSASYLNRINTIELGLLSPEEIEQLIVQVWGEKPPRSFVYRLANEVGGNPFAILETIGAFLERPSRPNLDEITRLPLVSSINQMIRMRLRMISPAGRDILKAAALYGGNLQVEIIAKVVALPEETVQQAFEELEKLHFIQRETADEQSDYVFVHEKFRESLLQDISLSNNILFNRRIAEALEARPAQYGPDQSAIIAQHYESAGLFSQAFDYWIRAAEYAQTLDSPPQAIAFYQRAERLVARTPGLSDEQLHKFVSSWSALAQKHGDYKTLLHIHRLILSLGEDRNSQLLLHTAHKGLSLAYQATKQPAQAAIHAQKASEYDISQI